MNGILGLSAGPAFINGVSELSIKLFGGVNVSAAFCVIELPHDAKFEVKMLISLHYAKQWHTNSYKIEVIYLLF